MLSSAEIVKRYLEFFKEKGHKQIANSPLVLANDPTTLFTSSGMQPLIPYLLGEVHEQGNKLVNVQNCIRTQDIEEVGDNRHTTFFRMMGNWSLGDYFKREQLSWFFEFLTDVLKLDPNRIYTSVFNGDSKYNISKDTESVQIWKKLFSEKGIDAKDIELGSAADGSKNGMQNGRIFYYDAKENWWSRAGAPENMPSGEPGGPDSEVFYEFPNVEHDKEYGEFCHPACDCGRFIEIGNSVFMQYIKQDNNSFKELPQKNVDFGGGLERLTAAVNDDPDVFITDLYKNIIEEISLVSSKDYKSKQSEFRIIADHMKAATFLMQGNVTPSNKEHGYILRRLLRRAAVKMYQIKEGDISVDGFGQIVEAVLKTEKEIDHTINIEEDAEKLRSIVKDEIEKFNLTLSKGLREMNKNLDRIDDVAFDLFQNNGFPFEIIKELADEKGKSVDKEKFDAAFKIHQDKSRSASAGKFRGGLADHSEKTVMGHTATHLLHQALRDILGSHVHQTGSNITSERVRFDFNYENKLTDEEMEKVQEIVNKKINENLPVHFELIPTQEAHKLGAIGLFMDTYGDKSKIYFIGPQENKGEKPYSIEFCGGPHVDFTGTLKSFKILKQENLGKNQKRIYAIVN